MVEAACEDSYRLDVLRIFGRLKGVVLLILVITVATAVTCTLSLTADDALRRWKQPSAGCRAAEGTDVGETDQRKQARTCQKIVTATSFSGQRGTSSTFACYTTS